MACATFHDKKTSKKQLTAESINRNDARILQIKGAFETGSKDEDAVEQVFNLVRLVEKDKKSKLSPGYVYDCLMSEGNHVVVYKRNKDKLPGEEGEDWISGFIIYDLNLEKNLLGNPKMLIASVPVLASFDSKRNLQNLLESKEDMGELILEGAGTQALKDLQYFLAKFARIVKTDSCEIREIAAFKFLFAYVFMP